MVAVVLLTGGVEGSACDACVEETGSLAGVGIESLLVAAVSSALLCIGKLSAGPATNILAIKTYRFFFKNKTPLYMMFR